MGHVFVCLFSILHVTHARNLNRKKTIKPPSPRGSEARASFPQRVQAGSDLKTSGMRPRARAASWRGVASRTGGAAWRAARLVIRKGGSIRVFRAQIGPFELFELVLLLKLDKRLPVERFKAAVSQSAVP